MRYRKNAIFDFRFKVFANGADLGKNLEVLFPEFIFYGAPFH